MRYGHFPAEDNSVSGFIRLTSGTLDIIVVRFIVICNRRACQKQKVENAGLILNDVGSRLGKAAVGVGGLVVWPLCGP